MAHFKKKIKIQALVYFFFLFKKQNWTNYQYLPQSDVIKSTDAHCAVCGSVLFPEKRLLDHKRVLRDADI